MMTSNRFGLDITPPCVFTHDKIWLDGYWDVSIDFTVKASSTKASEPSSCLLFQQNLYLSLISINIYAKHFVKHLPLCSVQTLTFALPFQFCRSFQLSSYHPRSLHRKLINTNNTFTPGLPQSNVLTVLITIRWQIKYLINVEANFSGFLSRRSHMGWRLFMPLHLASDGNVYKETTNVKANGNSPSKINCWWHQKYTQIPSVRWCSLLFILKDF